MPKRTEASPAVAPSIPKATLTATIPPSGRTSPSGKARGFAGLPQATDEAQEPSTAVVDEQCPVHPWCVERGDHTEHTSDTVTVHVECGVDEAHNHGHAATPYVEARLFSEDDPATGIRGDRPVVMIGDCEVSADGARREAAKLRAVAPRIEALADILDGKPAYIPPTSYASAETIKVAGASGALLKVYMFDPSKEEFGGYDGPRSVAVTHEMGDGADLDLAGAIDFRQQVAALLPKLDAMIGSLAADVRTEPPKTAEAQPSALAAVCTDLTDAAIRELSASTGLRWLGEDGPVFFLGQFRVRALFRGPDGRFWADAALAAESGTAGRDITLRIRDAWMDAAGRGVEQHDLMIASPQRGEWNALIAPVEQIAAQLHLPAPLPAPDGWARSWSSFPDMSEEQHLGAVEAGVLEVQR